jgi:sulfur carrier protein
MVTITVNGERREFERALHFGELIDRLGLSGRRVAIERNGEIVPRGEFSATVIVEGDELEIVAAVGGG